MHSLRSKLIVFWVAFTTLLVAVTNLIAFRTALDAQFQQLRQTLIAIATTGAAHIDGDAHARIPPESASVDFPPYKELTDRLREIKVANPSIKYVYTVAPSTIPGQWYYVGDAEEFKQSLPGESYKASRYPAMIAALQGPTADPQLTYDEWGPLLSGYAPIRKHDGTVAGVLGIDMSGSQVARTQEALRHWQLIVLCLGLGTAMILGVLSANWISRPIQALVQATQRIGSGDLSYRVPVQSDDEVGALARSFNHMSGLLADSMRKLQEHILATLQSLAEALEAKDVHTRGHSERVHVYAVKIAKRMGLSAEEIDLVHQFSRLHDIGKIGVKEDILNKPAKLTAEEFEVIKRHPDVGYRILVPLQVPKLALDIVRHHHERQDGKGYPVGLKGEEIPLPVAIVTVADAFDGMTGYRPYRTTPMTFEEAAAELVRCSGTQFHPGAVHTLLELLREDGKLSKAPAAALSTRGLSAAGG